MGKVFLVDIKDDLIETLKLALDTSRKTPDTFIDGFISDEDLEFFGEGFDRYISVESADNQRVNWYFEKYRTSSEKPIYTGEILGIRVDRDPVRIQGSLWNVSRAWESMGYEGHPNTVGLNGWGAMAFGVDMDVSLLGDKAEGTLSIHNGNWRDWDVASYYWTLEELSGKEHTYHSYSMEWEEIRKAPRGRWVSCRN